MKKKGATTDFADERNQDLMRVFGKLAAERRYVNVLQLCKQIVKMPTSRFWVSEERAREVVSALLRGENALSGMRESKRRMFQEIYRRVASLRQREPGHSLIHHVAQVIYSPAPEYYMEPANASYLIYQSMRTRRQQ